MQIKRTFCEKGVSIENLIDSVLAKSLDDIIDNEIFDSNEEGYLGGIENDNYKTGK